MEIRLREVGAKRPLNGTSKSEQTDTQTDGRTNRLIESISPEGRCFENLKIPIREEPGLTPSILPAKSESLHQCEMNNKVGR